jgi:Mce-associated membrane protein
MSGVSVKTAVEPEVESVAETEAEEPAVRESRLPQVLLTVAVALVVAAAAVAGWFGVAWFNAANDDSLEYSKVRDEVNRVGQAAVVTMNTLDYRKVDAGLKDWETATTGPLHDEVVKGKATSRDAIVAAESVTKATVLSSAVSELDDRAGQASVLVALKVNVTVKGEEPKDKFMRLAAKLQRTDDGWKLYEIGQVPYLQPGQ